VAPTRAEPGCINDDLHVDTKDPCVFVFYENWRSQADLDAHMKMPHLTPLMGEIARMLDCPVDIRHLTMMTQMVLTD
jgi:quinol monooxygenase YgiN